MVFVILPVGTNYGWGVCGKYIIQELSRLTSVKCVIPNFEQARLCTELEHRAIQGMLASPEEVKFLSSSNDKYPVLQAIGDNHLDPIQMRATGSRKVGYVFFETKQILSDDVAKARSYFSTVATGSSWCTSILKAAGLNEVQTIVQGIDPLVCNPSFSEKAMFTDRFVVFSGGKFEFRKGQDIVIRAYKVLQEKHRDVMLVNSWFNSWRFSLDTMLASCHIRFRITSEDHRMNITNLLHEHGIDVRRVVTLVPHSNLAMPRIYQNTDVGLFPNRCEGGTNLVLMEYMACGKPAIASYCTGHTDIVNADNSILIRNMKPVTVQHGNSAPVELDDPDLDETIHHLEWAYLHRDELRPIAMAAGQHLSNFTWKNAAEQFYGLLTDRAI